MNHLPKYLSYSALNTYEECPRAWYLGRLKRAEPKQTWFFPVGTTVHTALEAHMAGEEFSIKEIFYGLVREQLKIDSDDVNWLAGGSKDDPSIRGKALAQAEACVENGIKFLEDMDVHHVEYEILVKFPGCEVPVKMFIDVLGEHKKYGPLIVDWKTGKTKPKSPLQLEVYRAGTLLRDLPQYATGWWAMVNPLTTAKTARSRKIDLSSGEPAALGARFQRAYEDMKAKKYKAVHEPFKCTWCIQAPNCNVESLGSERAKFYDKSSEDGFPF